MLHGTLCAVAGTVFLAGAVPVSGAGVQVGEKAPRLNLERLLQSGDSGAAEWDRLKGKVVVLEFWATWCAPCVKALAHINELAEAFDDSVQFISITDETEPVVRQFLRHRAIKGWVGLDTDRSAFKVYGVQSIPTTIIVRRDGRVALRTTPERVDAALLRRALEGKALPPSHDEIDPRLAEALARVEQMRSGAPDHAESDAEPPLASALIRLAREPVSSATTRPTSFELHNESLRRILAYAYGKDALNIVGIRPAMEDRVEGPEAALRERYDVMVSVPPAHAGQQVILMRALLEASFEIEKQLRPTDVYVLRVPQGHDPKLEKALTQGHASRVLEPGRLLMIGFGTNRLCADLGDILGKPVIDETGIAGSYVWDLKYEAANPQSIVAAIRKQTGLELVMEERPIQIIILKRQASPGSDEK